MSSGLTRGQAPIQPTQGSEMVADPLAQAMTLTALVIGFAVTAVLLALQASTARATASTSTSFERDEEREQQAADEQAEDYDEAIR